MIPEKVPSWNYGKSWKNLVKGTIMNTNCARIRIQTPRQSTLIDCRASAREGERERGGREGRRERGRERGRETSPYSLAELSTHRVDTAFFTHDLFKLL